MVYVKNCETYEKGAVLDCVREIFDRYNILDDVSGLTVAVKPNLVCKKTPEHAATTHPSIVWAVCKLLKDAGADVVIAESPSGFYEPGLLKSLYKVTGIEQAAIESGARLNFDTTVTEVDNPRGKYLKKLKILTPLAKADRIINIAKLKTHGMMVYTGAVKNLFGSVAGLEKTQYHFQLSDYNEFADCIIDIFLANAPVFNIIDAVVAMHKAGPTAGEPYTLNKILASTDGFELDVVATTIVKVDPMRVPVLRSAIQRGFVSSNASSIAVVGDAGPRLPRKTSRAITAEKSLTTSCRKVKACIVRILALIPIKSTQHPRSIYISLQMNTPTLVLILLVAMILLHLS